MLALWQLSESKGLTFRRPPSNNPSNTAVTCLRIRFNQARDRRVRLQPRRHPAVTGNEAPSCRSVPHPALTVHADDPLRRLSSGNTPELASLGVCGPETGWLQGELSGSGHLGSRDWHHYGYSRSDRSAD